MTRVIAVLIGTSLYENNIQPIPNVGHNIKQLELSLKDSNVAGLSSDSIFLSLNGTLKKVKTVLAQASDVVLGKADTLIVYYSGHGFLSKKNRQLYLTTIDTDEKHLEATGFKIDDFKEMIDFSKAGKKILILDCCFSGRAIGTMGGTLEYQLEKQLSKFENNSQTGAFIMTSTDEISPAYYDHLNPNIPTYFTDELIKTIGIGTDTHLEYWPLLSLFDTVKEKLNNLQDASAPLCKIIGDGSKINVFKNVNYWNERLCWQSAIDENSISGYLNFKTRFPSSEHKKRLNELIAELEHNEKWKNVILKNTIDSYTEYLDNYPEGKNYAQAKLRKENLELQVQMDFDLKRKINALLIKLNNTILSNKLVSTLTGIFFLTFTSYILFSVYKKQNVLDLPKQADNSDYNTQLRYVKTPILIDTAKIHKLAIQEISGPIKNFDKYTIFMDSLINISSKENSDNYKGEAVRVLINNATILIKFDRVSACQSILNAKKIDPNSAMVRQKMKFCNFN